MDSHFKQSLTLSVIAVFCAGVSLMPLDASANRGGRGAGQARTSVNRSNVNRNANMNRNANVNRNANANVNRNANVNANRNVNANINRNVNVNRDIDVDVDHRWNHPVGTAMAVAATAAVIGSIVYSLPPSCSMTQIGGVTYQQCGSTWYQPRYAGSSVQYVVVNSPY
jgi:hypothetical protein